MSSSVDHLYLRLCSYRSTCFTRAIMNKSFKLFQRLWNSSRTIVRHYAYPTSFRHFLQNQNVNTQYSKLCNGLTIATEERADMPHACVGLYIDAGSRYENDFENGIAHFFEHIVFKSTNSRSKKELEKAMTSIGANFKCKVTREMVCFYAETLVQHVPLALDLLCDCVFNNALNCCDIEKQKTVIYGEMLEHDEDTNAVLYDYLHSAAFQGTPLGQSVMGPSGNLYNFDANTICNYLNRCFEPTRTVLAAVGGVKHDHIVNLANCYLCHLWSVRCIENDPYRYTGSEVRYRNDSMPAANVVMAVEGPSWRNDDNIVMEVARVAMGAWDRSQLFGNHLAGEVAQYSSTHKYCDAYKTFNITYKDTGLWGVQFISDVSNLDYMSNNVQGEWMYLCNCITEAEVDRAKRFYKTKLLSDSQSATKICHDLGRWMLYVGCRPTLLEKITATEHVFAKDVREVCSKYLYNKCPAVVAIGRTEGLMEYQRLRSAMFWLRY